MNEDLSHIDVRELLPQRPPFVLIDRLLHCDPVVTQTSLSVTDETLFVEDGRLSASGLIENIAQTCAARMGYMNRQAGGEVKLGFIGAIRDLNLMRTPAVGERLLTTIEVVQEVFQMTLVKAKVESAGEILVETELKIALSEVSKR